MMLNASDVEAVVHEIAPILRGGWIQKIQQPTERLVVLEIRVPGQTHRLLISCATESSRLHLTHRSLTNPPTPRPFCQYLRAHIQGARVEDIRQILPYRIVELVLTGKEGTSTIVCELTGGKATLLVLDSERRIIRDLLNQRSRMGESYTLPAAPEPQRHTTRSRFTGSIESPFPVSASIEAYYQEQEATQDIVHAKELRLRLLKKTLKKEQRLVEAWQGDLSRASKYQGYARYGELLKANLNSVMKGADQLTLTDYYDERLPQITIPLDPTKSGQANMDDYFRKHRKHLTAERELKPRIERAQQNLERLRQEIRDIEQGTWSPPAAIPSTSHAGTISQPLARKSLPPNDQRRGPFRRFISADGLPIFVGRNAKENDELTFGLAKSDDLWLHARGTPGSHVVIRLEKGTDPPIETLRDAATLALLYSDLKKAGKGEVIYTRRKWVKKAKGQAPGSVIVTQEKSLYVSLDKKRLEALKSHVG